MRKLFQQLKNRHQEYFDSSISAGDGPEFSPLLKTPPWESSQPGSASPSSLPAAIVVGSSSTSNSSPDLAPCMVLEGMSPACSEIKYPEMLLKSKLRHLISLCVYLCECMCVWSICRYVYLHVYVCVCEWVHERACEIQGLTFSPCVVDITCQPSRPWPVTSYQWNTTEEEVDRKFSLMGLARNSTQ